MADNVLDLNFGVTDEFLSEFIFIFHMTDKSVLYTEGPEYMASTINNLISTMSWKFIRGYITIVLVMGKKYIYKALHHPIHAVMREDGSGSERLPIPLVSTEEAESLGESILMRCSSGLQDSIPEVIRRVRPLQEKEEEEYGREYFSELFVYTSLPADKAFLRDCKTIKELVWKHLIVISVFCEGDEEDGDKIADAICNSSNYTEPGTKTGAETLMSRMKEAVMYAGDMHRFRNSDMVVKKIAV